MTELKVGDRIKDNDPRMGERVLTIDAVGVSRVRASRGGRFPVWILINRIFTDDKPCRTGFSLVRAAGFEKG